MVVAPYGPRICIVNYCISLMLHGNHKLCDTSLLWQLCATRKIIISSVGVRSGVDKWRKLPARRVCIHLCGRMSVVGYYVDEITFLLVVEGILHRWPLVQNGYYMSLLL